MRSLKVRRKTTYKDVQIEVTDSPHVLYVYKPNGMVALPADIYHNFKSLDEIVSLVGPYLERMNA